MSKLIKRDRLAKSNVALDMHDAAVAFVPVSIAMLQEYQLDLSTDALLIGGACVAASLLERSARRKLSDLPDIEDGDTIESRTKMRRVAEFVPFRLRGWGLAVMSLGFVQEVAAIPTMDKTKMYYGLATAAAGLAMTAVGACFRPEEMYLQPNEPDELSPLTNDDN